MKEEDIKIIASVADWSDMNKLMMQAYYEQFGKLLEHKLDSLQQRKLAVKELIRQVHGSSKVPVTPKRLNPTKKLLEQIHQMKTLCFESDDDEGENIRVTCKVTPLHKINEEIVEKSSMENQISRAPENIDVEVTNSPFPGSASRFSMPEYVPLPFFHASSSPVLPKGVKEVINSSADFSEVVPETPSPAARYVTFGSEKSLSNVFGPPQGATMPLITDIPTTLTNYDVDDLNSNDETDDDENPRKVVPLWASPDILGKHVLSVNRLLSQTQREHHFGQIKKPELRILFPDYVPKKQPMRKSKVSAMWESPLTDPRVGRSRFQQFSQHNPRSVT